MTDAIDRQPRPASGALTKTGGFLTGFTHTLQPYIGCRFGCEYCYVKGLNVHRFHQPALAWGDYVHPRVGIAEQLRKELARIATRGQLGSLAIFMSSATDPYQGQERQWRLSRACLDLFLEYPPGLLVVQTRSPLVQDDFERLRMLGDRCWLNFTVESNTAVPIDRSALATAATGLGAWAECTNYR
jgi:DNA repair photolyase